MKSKPTRSEWFGILAFAGWILSMPIVFVLLALEPPPPAHLCDSTFGRCGIIIVTVLSGPFLICLLLHAVSELVGGAINFARWVIRQFAGGSGHKDNVP